MNCSRHMVRFMKNLDKIDAYCIGRLCSDLNTAITSVGYASDQRWLDAEIRGEIEDELKRLLNIRYELVSIGESIDKKLGDKMEW